MENPALSLWRRRHSRAWSCVFQPKVFTLHLHAEITHSVCETHLLVQTHALVLMLFEPCNYAPVTHASTENEPLEILWLLTHQIHVMSSRSTSSGSDGSLVSVRRALTCPLISQLEWPHDAGNNVRQIYGITTGTPSFASSLRGGGFIARNFMRNTFCFHSLLV